MELRSDFKYDKAAVKMPEKQKQYLLNHLQESVMDYVQLPEDATLEDLNTQFGSPDQINSDQLADSLTTMDEKQIEKKWSTARKVRLWLIILGAAIVVGLLITYVCILIYNASHAVTVVESDLQSVAYIPSLLRF